jgi:hypothetical protein
MQYKQPCGLKYSRFYMDLFGYVLNNELHNQFLKNDEGFNKTSDLPQILMNYLKDRYVCLDILSLSWNLILKASL